MKASLKRFYEYIASQPCLRCTAQPVEVAHIKGFTSSKTGELLPRRQGIAAYAAIPLCVECHRLAPDSIHAVGEKAFFARFKTAAWVYAYLARSLAEALA